MSKSKPDWIMPFCEHSWPAELIGPIEFLIHRHGYSVRVVDDHYVRIEHRGSKQVYGIHRNGCIVAFGPCAKE